MMKKRKLDTPSDDEMPQSKIPKIEPIDYDSCIICQKTQKKLILLNMQKEMLIKL